MADVNRSTEALRSGLTSSATLVVPQTLPRTDPPQRADLAQEPSSSDEIDRQITDLDIALKGEPQSADAHIRRGELWIKKGTAQRALVGDTMDKVYFDRAIADFDEALRINPVLAIGYHDRGVAHVKKGEVDRAIADFSEAIRLDPNNALALKYRGSAFAYKGNSDRAIVDLTKAIQLSGPNNNRMPAAELVLALSSRSILYGIKGLYDRELADLSATIEAYFKNPDVAESFRADWGAVATAAFLMSNYQRRAKLYMKNGAYDRALADLNRAIELDPNHGFLAYVDRGTIRVALGQRDDAIADFRKALAINPNVKEATEALKRLGAAAN